MNGVSVFTNPVKRGKITNIAKVGFWFTASNLEIKGNLKRNK